DDGAAERQTLDHRSLGRLDLADVDRGAHVASEGALHVKAGRAAVEDVAIGAVRAAQPVLERERPLDGQGSENGAHASLAIVWMDALDPSVADFLAQGA